MIHSSNTVLRLTIKGASYDMPETLFYFESSRCETVGLFECSTCPEIPVGERIKIELFTRNELVECLDSVFIIRKEFTNPDYGNVSTRYIFSTHLESTWQINPVKLDMLHYKSDRIYDYAVTDAVKALNNTITTKINNWTRNCTCGDDKT
jgi:hypothetical protein